MFFFPPSVCLLLSFYSPFHPFTVSTLLPRGLYVPACFLFACASISSPRRPHHLTHSSLFFSFHHHTPAHLLTFDPRVPSVSWLSPPFLSALRCRPFTPRPSQLIAFSGLLPLFRPTTFFFLILSLQIFSPPPLQRLLGRHFLGVFPRPTVRL